MIQPTNQSSSDQKQPFVVCADRKPMTFGSLFAGIGGIDLGFERAGLECRWQVEINPYARSVLARHWPEVRRWDDVKTWPQPDTEPVDVIAGGFPCQDVSQAGPKVGIDGKRSGLWREFKRIIDVVRPRYAVVENAAGLLDRGMGRVLGDLASIGFDARWTVLSSCRFGAPHMRRRVFIVAYAKSERQGQLRRIECESESQTNRHVHWSEDESGVPRELDGVPNRMERCTAIGNAVDPRVAEWVGRYVIASSNSVTRS